MNGDVCKLGQLNNESGKTNTKLELKELLRDPCKHKRRGEPKGGSNDSGHSSVIKLDF